MASALSVTANGSERRQPFHVEDCVGHLLGAHGGRSLRLAFVVLMGDEDEERAGKVAH